MLSVTYPINAFSSTHTIFTIQIHFWENPKRNTDMLYIVQTAVLLQFQLSVYAAVYTSGMILFIEIKHDFEVFTSLFPEGWKYKMCRAVHSTVADCFQ